MTETLPPFPTAWDSTMLGTFKECPRKFYFSHILNWRSGHENIHLIFGRLFHAGLERYYHALARGENHDAASLSMISWAMEATWEPAVLDEDGRELSPPGPWTPDSSTPAAAWKNRPSLIRSLVWYVEDDLERPTETVFLADGSPAVELSFRFSPFSVEVEGSPIPILLCGHFDRIVRLNDRMWVRDPKTTYSALTANFWRGFTPHNQFTLYTIAGGVVLGEKCEGVLVDGVQIGVHFTRTAIQPVPRPNAVQSEWLDEAREWIQSAADMHSKGRFPGNDKSCSNYGGCPFQKVCAVSPSHRAAWLKADFIQWKWDPLEIRGDI